MFGKIYVHHDTPCPIINPIIGCLVLAIIPTLLNKFQIFSKRERLNPDILYSVTFRGLASDFLSIPFS